MPPVGAPRTKVGAGVSGAGRFRKLGDEFKANQGSVNRDASSAGERHISARTPVTGNLIDLSGEESSTPPIPHHSKPQISSAENSGHAGFSGHYQHLPTGRPTAESLIDRDDTPPPIPNWSKPQMPLSGNPEHARLSGHQHLPTGHDTTRPPEQSTYPVPPLHTDPATNHQHMMQQQMDMQNQQMQNQMQMQHQQMQMHNQQMQLQMQTQQMQQMQQMLSQAVQGGAHFTPEDMHAIHEMSSDPSRQHELMQFITKKTMEGTYQKLMVEQVQHTMHSFVEAFKEGNKTASSAI